MYHKSFTNAAIFSGLALVYAQDLAALPECARDAITQALGTTGCSLADTACICASPAFTSIGTNIASVCSAEDVNAAIAAGQSICATAPASSSSSAPPEEPTPDPYPSGEDGSQTASTTTAPGTVTSTTVLTDTTLAIDTSAITSISTISSNNTHTGPLTTTGTITLHSSTGTPTGTGSPWQSTFNGMGATDKAQGLFAGAVGVIGAIALL
ncbi:uncharacterized protein A1O9_02458 [Exophiala aquamarina CBS 119918]|uniref:CFEM domain-containing protein n=1 Tax=Exophiala aquamarina CBS 119918 TaxID=1182545 RepID=A0A072PLD1_9EURO|nr:uncharacterized protein A1O9_02458 [Exophiala aquamarina CBS 119918]KEF60894.1 hypothetical protein A1O9_02458 [Exophiala aquamarina CBS 119918]